MKKTEIKKAMETAKIEHLETFKNLLMDIKKELLKNENKTFRSPLKDDIINNLKDLLKNKYNKNNNSFIYLQKNNNIYINYDFYFSYYNFKKFFIDKQENYFTSEEKHLYTTSEKEAFSVEIVFTENKIKNNNIDELINDLTKQQEKIKNMLTTFDQDIQTLEKLYNLIDESIKKYNSINYDIRSFFGGDGGCDYIQWLKNNYFKNDNCYLLINNKIDVVKMVDQLEKSKFYLNNKKNIYDVNIIDDRLLELYFFNNNIDNTFKIIYDLKNEKIIFNNFDNINFNNFDVLDDLSDSQYQEIEKKAKFKMLKLKNDDKIIKSKNDFKLSDEMCFISSNDLHGFYFPNVEISYNDIFNNNYKFLAIAFINDLAFGVFENEKDGSLLLL